MSSVNLQTMDARNRFCSGESIQGTVTWSLPEPPSSIELRLFWYTQGKGAEDVETVDTFAVPVSGRAGQAPFMFTLPAEPYSFSGRLISLRWAIEAICFPTNDLARLDFVVSPWESDVVLDKLEDEKKSKAKSWYVRGR